jgi:UDP-2,3-diacylglucosamine pyrophosphatase LpxH
MKFSVVFSDLHFGDPRCTLHSMKTARHLLRKLSEFQPLQEIILLGDILDLQLANWAQALEGRFAGKLEKRAAGFRYFLNVLLKETGVRKVVYVPGNHDYRVFDYLSVERYLMGPLKRGKKLSGKIAFFRKFQKGFLQGIIEDANVSLQILYPHYSMRIAKSRVILTHGHLFDPSQAFSHEVGKVFRESENLSREEIRKIRERYFRRVSLYQNVVSGLSMKKELRNWFSSLYEPLTAFKQSWEHKSRKSFVTPAMRKSIEAYVRYCCRPGKVQGLIFGHTHKPGKIALSSGPVHYVWNAGTFLRESQKSPLGSFITIEHSKKGLPEAVQVHILT